MTRSTPPAAPPGGRRRRRLLAALLTFFVVLAAACGSDDDSADESAQDPADATTSTLATDDGGAPTNGGTAVVALVQEPGSFNLFHSKQSGAFLNALAIEPLFGLGADGTYEPYLAAEVPTMENGGISPDGLTVTYRLREGITWSDGEPFTAHDMVFTWEATLDEGSRFEPHPAFWSVESLEATDDLTAVATMYEPTPGYLAMWRDVLPAHLHEDTAVTSDDPDAEMPLGTGPFVFDSWQRGDTVTLVRNENYWRDPELPRLDGISLKVTPDHQTAMASFIDGEYDAVYFITSGDLAPLQDAAESGAPIVVEPSERVGAVEWLWLNQTAGEDPSVPHPVLSDLAIREAIDLGIDRELIIDSVLDGNASVVGNSLLYLGQYTYDVEPNGYDPDAAAAVLDEAGWEMGPDGVRVRDGVEARLRFTTVSGDQVRELYQQIIQQNLADIGIAVDIENAPSDLLFAGYTDGGMIASGDFDIAMSREGEIADPTDFAYIDLFTCSWIASPDNPEGWAYTRWCNEEFDAHVATAASTLDPAVRGPEYEAAVEIFAEAKPALAVYASGLGDAWNDRLAGVSNDGFDGMWSPGAAADWYLAG
ncbi:MAG: peptide ABC transporter substrate-binding protein [Actinomycetota bacterium]|nr:peptide ABC transporter substrate-binding protein [Actinomycetota bacterium]